MITRIENERTYTANGLGETRPNIRIGGVEKDRFVPAMNMSFQCGGRSEEYFLSLSRPQVNVGLSTEALSLERRLSLIVGDTAEVFHIKDGELKWDLVFSEQPKTNVFEWDMYFSPGMVFDFQPELTERQIQFGEKRPENIVGSYAVYCDRRNGRFKTGKLFHIKRPLCIDRRGQLCWAILEIEVLRPGIGKLRITIPGEYLDTATYPVTLDPQIGYTTAGASQASGTYLIVVNINNTMSESGTATDVYAYFYNDGTADNCLFGYYDDDAGPDVCTPTGGNEISVGSTGWHSASVSGSLTNGETYYPAVAQETNNELAYDSGGSYGDMKYAGSYSMPDSPSLNDYVNSYSVYVEYTSAAVGGNPWYMYSQQ